MKTFAVHSTTINVNLMPSAHGPIFCRKELREKVKVRFVIGVSQLTRTDFLSQTKHRTYLTIFLSECHLAHTARFFYRSYCRRGPIVGLQHSDFFIGLKSPHTDRFFCRKQLREKFGPIYYRTKCQRTRTDFLRQKIGPCALGIRSLRETGPCNL